ncbi:MAG: hypothetical protein HYX88_04595 [Chloroflexi bacterium]|nr:hypothetical protein [Chloroflexota bacterium]
MIGPILWEAVDNVIDAGGLATGMGLAGYKAGLRAPMSLASFPDSRLYLVPIPDLRRWLAAC